MLKEMLSPEDEHIYFAPSFPIHSPHPPITWHISFALEKWTLSRNSQLWFFFSDFPCLTWGVQTGVASSLNARRYLQFLLYDFFSGWKIPCPQSQREAQERRWMGLRWKLSQVPGQEHRKWQWWVLLFLFSFLPLLGFLLWLFKGTCKNQLQLSGRLYCTGVLFGSLSLSQLQVLPPTCC